MKKDMTKQNWVRTVKRLRREMEKMREYDIQCIEPPNFDTPPALRGLPPSAS